MVDSLIFVPLTELFGKAGFDAPSKSNPPTPLEIPEDDYIRLNNMSEGYSLIQKGLFFVVILSCVAIYLRLTSKKQKPFPEKSMV